MMDILTRTLYLGNTPRQWLIAAAIILMTVLAAKIVYWVFGSAVRQATTKAKTRLDDILVDTMEAPVVFALILMGVWYALATLKLSESAHRWLATGYYFLIIIVIAWFLIRLIDALIVAYLVPREEKELGGVSDPLLSIVRKGLKVTIGFVAVILALNNAGYNVGGLLLLLVWVGLALALGARDAVANLFAAFTIFTDKPFTLHDRVEVDGYDGVVERIGLQSIRIRTPDGRLVTLSNKRITESVVVNISSEPGRRVVLSVRLSDNMDHHRIQEALDLLASIARNTKGVDPDRITTAFTGFGDDSLRVQLIYWVQNGTDFLEVQTAVNLKVWEEFAAHGLKMAFPVQTTSAVPSDA